MLFVVLALFFLSTSSNKSYHQNPEREKIESVFTILANQGHSVIVDAVTTVSIQKSCIKILSDAQFNLFNKTYKVLNDNRRSTQLAIALRKRELVTLPTLQPKLRFLLYQSESIELPSLS